MFKITIICVFLTVQMEKQKCEKDSFSAVAAMEKLLETQARLIEDIGYSQKFVDAKERSIVNMYLAKLKKENALSRGDPEHYLGNPINSYALIMRLFRDLQFVERILNKTNTYRRNNSLVYPSSTDVEGANGGLMGMQVMYSLDIQQLANGILITHFSKDKQQFHEFVSPLTANDCFDLANLYFDKDDRSTYVTWLQEAHKKYKSDHKLCPFTEDELVKNIAGNYYFMEDWNRTIYWLERYLDLNRHDFEAMDMLEFAKDQYEESDDNQKKLSIHIPLEKRFNFNPKILRLCRYESGRSAGNVSLSCYYAHGPHAFLRLAPIKAEILHRNPDITMFYDVISDAEIEVFKSHAKPKLQRSEVLIEGARKVSSDWTSQTASMPYELTEVGRVKRRIQQFTGLRWSQSVPDKMVVGNYGIAGYYTPHFDFLLSNVEQGGATIFLEANLTVFPEKNAGLFWYNLDPWGTGDSRTLHAACPVLRGSKWVSNKWLLLFEQDLSRRCPVYPPEPERPSVNKRRLKTKLYSS